MSKNPLSQKQWDKLTESVKWSERQLEFSKKKRIQAITEFAGYHYAEGGAQLRVPVPMLALAVQIYVRTLAARAPRALFTSKQAQYKPVAYNMELAINQIPDEIGLAATLRKYVEEALFSMGVVKVGLCSIGKSLGHEYGETFVDLVTTDDYFMDMSAKSMQEIAYEGNQYWLDYEECKESGWLDGLDIESDEPTTKGPAGEKRADGITINSTAEQYRERLWLRDIWLPREKVLVTASAKTGKFLKSVEWDGPKSGPYIKLGYSDVPGNLLPLPPVSLWRDLHELSNKLFRKLGNQADAQKSVMGFQGGEDESVNNFKGAKDGDGVRYTGAQPIELKTAGVDPKTLAFYLQCRDMFSYFAGNLDSLGGLGIQAPTLGQDKLLGEAASAQMRDMVDRTIASVREIFYALAYYEWNDPIKRRTLEKPIPGIELTIPVEFGPEQKDADFDVFDLNIDVYSLQDNSPSARLQKLGAIVQQYVLPLAPMIQQNSGTIDVQKIFKLVAKYSDFPELEEIVTFVDQATLPSSPSGSLEAGMPANTNRTYTRVGQPGMSRGGEAASLTQQLLSGGGEESMGAQE
jgi:hypothetical protein